MAPLAPPGYAYGHESRRLIIFRYFMGPDALDNFFRSCTQHQTLFQPVAVLRWAWVAQLTAKRKALSFSVCFHNCYYVTLHGFTKGLKIPSYKF